jgi:hypothetical protein
MMGSLPGCVYSRTELQSSDCLSTISNLNTTFFTNGITGSQAPVPPKWGSLLHARGVSLLAFFTVLFTAMIRLRTES